MIPMDFFKDEIYEWIPKLASVDLLLVVEIFFKNLFGNAKTNHVMQGIFLNCNP